MLAGIEHVNGKVWHSARRRAATDLKHLPPKDVAMLMGWETVEMVSYCQHPDEDTTRAALESRRQEYSLGR